MSAAKIAQQHVDQALAEAKAGGFDLDATARYMLGAIVRKYLEYRPIQDVRAELEFVAENCDPDTDYMFMRP
jgi:hypothetical protein